MRNGQNAWIKAFFNGTCCDAHQWLGLHRTDEGYVFRLWAPKAKQVFVVGNFNEWGDQDPMNRISDEGIWEVTLSADRVHLGQKYQYKLVTDQGEFYREDPFGSCREARARAASVVAQTEGYPWKDKGWLAWRKQYAQTLYKQPLNVYRMLPGAWKRHGDRRVYGYRELATELAPYLKQMGYTHLLWDQTVLVDQNGRKYSSYGAYFSPSSLFGTPEEFMGFVDSMHEAGIGVILGWNPCFFAKEEQGLASFDGAPLYEYTDPSRADFGRDGFCRFDLSRKEVVSFLQSSLLCWMERYHVDGVSVEGVSPALYLDYGRWDGVWQANSFGENRCLEAIEFFRNLNRFVRETYPEVIMIAEETSEWQGVTAPLDKMGLGFDLRWNSSWTKDAMDYCQMDPIYRKYHHEKMTFSMIGAFSEQYLLSIPSEGTILARGVLGGLFGDEWQRFATHRALLGLMMTHPGKKLVLMGTEIGQQQSLDPWGELDWGLLDYVSHARLQRFVSELNHLYLQSPPLWEIDDCWDGFRWIDPDNREQSVLTYYRTDSLGHFLIVALNFTPVVRDDFLLGVPTHGVYEELLNSDELRFGGSGVTNVGEIFSTGRSWNYQPYSIRLRLPPLGMTILRCRK